MTPEAVEANVLQSVVVPELQAEGYDVYLYPKRPKLPEFFGTYPPDAIAFGAKKNLVVEVLQRTPNAEQKLERIRALLKDQKNWELRVFWAEPASPDRTVEAQTPDAIRKNVIEIRELCSRKSFTAALLVSWATFEAVGRILIPEQFKRPQTPGRLVQVLAQSGHLTPSEADSLRRLASLRNSLIHGDLSVTVPLEDIEVFVVILETLLSEIA